MPNRSEMVIDAVLRKFNMGGSGWQFYYEIRMAYTKPKRSYHTLNGHIEACLKDFRQVEKCAQNPLVVTMALVTHDAIMDFQRQDNEERSADFAKKILMRMGTPESFQEEVANLILATKHNVVPETEDAKLMTDIDLSIFGKSRWQFSHYERGIRKEYAFVPDDIFRQERAKILRSFLDRPSIYLTDYFQKKYEAQARVNLKRSIAQLGR